MPGFTSLVGACGGWRVGSVKFGGLATTRTTTFVRGRSAVKLDKFAPTNTPGDIPTRVTLGTRGRRTTNHTFGVGVLAKTSAKRDYSKVLTGTRTVGFHAPCAAGGSFHARIGGGRVDCSSLGLSGMTARVHRNCLNGIS